MKRSILSNTLMAGCMALLVASCGKTDPNSPGIEYMPDMYRSPSYETNMAVIEGNDTVSANRVPPQHAIARGKMPYMYMNNVAGYDSAGKFLKNPMPFSPALLADGEVLYSKYCVHCHGATGGGDGLVAAKLPGPPPAYSGPLLKDLPEGKIFHSITYGKNMMGPHASLLTTEERWKLVHYVQKLQGSGQGAAPAATPAVSDTTIKTASAQDSIPSGAAAETKK